MKLEQKGDMISSMEKNEYQSKMHKAGEKKRQK
jgi:hypothetical protein